MNISYNWLKEYLDFDLSPEETGKALTSIGLEVGSVEEKETIKGGLKGLVVGHVLTCDVHPNSDHLHVCTVDLGTGEPAQIVCGAPNVAAGQKVIVATLGCKLYDGDNEFVIKKSKLRGVESNGMICAEDEIGVGSDHSGIIVLPDEVQVGMPAAEYYHIKSNYIIEVDITPNRSDACSHYGVARDLYAWLVRNGKKASLHRPDCDAFKVDNHDLEIAVDVEDKVRCPRYCAVTVKGCKVEESPQWLQEHLLSIGLRPINNIVDITNYIMFAYGQPLHCFDADMIKGNKVVVRTMPEGTPFVTLDGVEHKLSSEDLAICNAEEPMCIAGVFGGKGSGTYETTTNVLFESAYFNPTSIRKSARRHGLSTDASFRFERGIDPNGQIYALKQAAILTQQIAGGTVSMEIQDSNPATVPGYKVNLKYSYVHQLIGKEIPHEVIREILNSLEMEVTHEDENSLDIVVPPYRTDVQRPCDVVEDILRIYGYNNVEIPLTVNSSLTIKGETDRSNKLQNLISEQLVGAGFNEIMNNSLTKASYYQDGTFSAEHAVKVMNPLSEDLSVMRQTLLYGGLESLKRNINHKNPNLRFFEFGNCYRFNEANRRDNVVLSPYSEDYHLGLFICGKRVEGSWAHPDEDSSIYELKANVENIFMRLGLNLAQFKMQQIHDDVFVEAMSITSRSGKELSRLGIVRPEQTAKAEVQIPVYFADLNWTLIMKETKKNALSFQEISNYPKVSRDLALLVDKSVTFLQIEEVAYSSERNLLKRVELFDVYEGKNLPEGKKSYAVNFVLQDESKTLTDKQIEKIMNNLIRNLEQRLGASLR
jgi:phenylalanyl-tRNA synthetase beta chain